MSGPNCPREFSIAQKEAEDRLREAVSFNDLETACTLIQRGVNINSKNSINEWTALHWACKRNNREAVSLLLTNGADPQIRTADGKLPGELSTNDMIRSMCGIEEPLATDGSSSGDPGFMPNYLRHPQLNYRVDLGAPLINPRRAGGSGEATASLGTGEDLVVKVRMAGVEEFFIEIDLPKNNLTYENLLNMACQELQIQDQSKVKRIVKLPNTLIRRDKDVERLKEFQEIELIMH